MTRGVKIREREWATEGYAGLFVTLPVGVAWLGQLTAAVGGIVGQLGIGGDDDVGRCRAMKAPSGGDILLFHCGVVFNETPSVPLLRGMTQTLSVPLLRGMTCGSGLNSSP